MLADRAFTVEESVGVYCAEVKVPPFTWEEGGKSSFLKLRLTRLDNYHELEYMLNV